jgi:CheY-like chemotaxis protein
VTRILVVDDDRSVACSITALLEFEGFDAAIAGDGPAGVAAVESEAFDLVIVDIFMPGMDGLETIAAIRQRQPDLPVIAISGFMPRHSALPAGDVLARAVELGASHALHKPFRRPDILAAIAACLGGAIGQGRDAAA